MLIVLITPPPIDEEGRNDYARYGHCIFHTTYNYVFYTLKIIVLPLHHQSHIMCKIQLFHDPYSFCAELFSSLLLLHIIISRPKKEDSCFLDHQMLSVELLGHSFDYHKLVLSMF